MLSTCWCCLLLHNIWLACALQLKKCVSLAPLSQHHMQLAASLAVHNMLLASGQWHACPGPGSLLSADPLRAAPGVMCSCAHLDITVVVQAPGLVLLAVSAGAMLVLASRSSSCVSDGVCCGIRQGSIPAPKAAGQETSAPTAAVEGAQTVLRWCLIDVTRC